jgi:hypothetical protein
MSTSVSRSLLASAALGLMASACGGNTPASESPAGSASAPPMSEKSGCKGENGCKAEGEKHACKGENGCKAEGEKHACKGENGCKAEGEKHACKAEGEKHACKAEEGAAPAPTPTAP